MALEVSVTTPKDFKFMADSTVLISSLIRSVASEFLPSLMDLRATVIAEMVARVASSSTTPGFDFRGT